MSSCFSRRFVAVDYVTVFVDVRFVTKSSLSPSEAVLSPLKNHLMLFLSLMSLLSLGSCFLEPP